MTHITVSDHDGVALLTADRPPVNAMDVGLLEEIVDTAAALAADPPRALVLAGRPGTFSAGADLKATPAYTPDEQRRSVDGINRMAVDLYALPCPVVAAITGHAIAGGFVLALTADHRVASNEGRYGLTEVKVGLPFPQAAIVVTRAELTAAAVRRFALGNRLHDAETCVRLGAFDEAVAPDEVLPRALEVAHELAELPADVYARTKHDLRGAAIAQAQEAAEDDPLRTRWVGSPRP